jgi:hypothetical protein
MPRFSYSALDRELFVQYVKLGKVEGIMSEYLVQIQRASELSASELKKIDIRVKSISLPKVLVQ